MQSITNLQKIYQVSSLGKNLYCRI